MSETVRVKFVTKEQEYVLPMGDFAISTALNRKGLSDALNQALELEKPVPFDFKINGNFLRQSLAQAMRLYQISPEQILTLEYFPAFKPPELKDEQKTDDWISCIKYKNGELYYSLYNGTIHCGEKVYEFVEEGEDPVPFKSFAFIGDNTLIAGGLDGSGTVFTLDGSKQTQRLELHNSAVNAIATHQNVDQMFITAGADYCLALWSLALSNLQPFVGHTDSVTDVHWIEENTIVSSSLDRSIRLWDVNTFQEKYQMSSTSGILSISVEGPLIISAHTDRSVKLWDTRETEHRSVVREFKSHTNWVSKVLFMSNDVFVSGGYDGAVKAWNIGTGVPLCTISQHDEKVFALANENNTLAIGGTEQVIRKAAFTF
ncbi:hypothetical protein TVAG_266620 [Trichomonas vaginalis G3]|uniref:NLE domain-containing protein n=1 Tax=Trichomonas vaginalis (strain ATCC PRA-98 / G3) TaxID=412133 RepID=A2DQL5_TRIV3|nr:ribosomal large subunit biogenesis [Trichomonas vaginalis G3]EAY17299.1 hypothetical protein TVAG_266620 [Trichomonas vaginalis G3]KAI5523300.1 ribosomal large subunit biogenesis [Trichomonas vaginalis G3]|eukprot:XP_001329522.1 hypothetical protein [Trichomonas vaginalis G3]